MNNNLFELFSYNDIVINSKTLEQYCYRDENKYLELVIVNLYSQTFKIIIYLIVVWLKKVLKKAGTVLDHIESGCQNITKLILTISDASQPYYTSEG